MASSGGEEMVMLLGHPASTAGVLPSSCVPIPSQINRMAVNDRREVEKEAGYPPPAVLCLPLGL